MKKLPPHQALVAEGKWPIIGEAAPRESEEPWTLTLSGLVAQEKIWSLEELRRRPQIERVVDIHCVTRWSKLGARFSGLSLRSLLSDCDLHSSAAFLSFRARSEAGHHSSLKLSDIEGLDPMLALSYEGRALEKGHGGPLRLVVEGRYFYKSVKWVEAIEVLAEDRLGTWEGGSGYHNLGDPWLEQRYMVSGLTRDEMQTALKTGDLSGREILSLFADNFEFEQLNAKESLLRNASFRGARLYGARFQGCNLCNSHFQKAQLRGASFVDADLEGANFEGADIRGVDFRGARLFGASFCREDGGGEALLDEQTIIEESQLTVMSEVQKQFLARFIQ